jgi:rhodanese-related sulfurtransferase
MFQKLFGRGEASAITQLSVADLQRKLAANESLQLIDVRSAEEYQHDGHIVGAKLIPLPALAQRLGEIDRAQAVVLICRSGNRSQVAADLLAGQGFSTVSNLQGGMSAWRRAGYPAR